MRNQSVAGTTISTNAVLAATRKTTSAKNAASADGTLRRSSHSSNGTSAIATTSAAVNGRKNSAPACKAKGIVGLVTDAGTRDGPAVRDLGFNVFCYGLSIKGTVKETLGSINQPIVIGGVTIHPGDFVSADDDGVVVVPKANLLEVAKASQAREDKEAEVMRKLREGGDILELSGMKQVLAAKNASWR